MGQRGLFDKEAIIAQMHGVEEGGRLAAFLWGQMLIAKVHEHHLPGPNRGRRKAAHNAIRCLMDDALLARALRQDREVAAGVNDKAGGDDSAVLGKDA